MEYFLTNLFMCLNIGTSDPFLNHSNLLVACFRVLNFWCTGVKDEVFVVEYITTACCLLAMAHA